MANDILEILGISGPPASDTKSKPAMFENPFSFNGRIRRTEYGISLILYLVMYVNMLSNYIPEEKNLGAFFFVAIPALWFLWAQGAKRCHDLGHSGWWQLIPFYSLWMLFQDGQPGENEYGENPKGVKSGNELSF